MRINEKLGGIAPEDNNEGFFALFSSALTIDRFADTNREYRRLQYGFSGWNFKSTKSIILEKQQELAALIEYQESRQTKTQ
jgi:hypothetical protein